MDQCYKVQFTAKLSKFTLALKMDCSLIVSWKRGEKIAQTTKVPFNNQCSYFNDSLTISCNMIYDPNHKLFKEKITKFELIIYTEKGDKKVGQILFDVSNYLNEKSKKPKQFEVGLTKCPDKNAKLIFTISAAVGQSIAMDNISQSSERTVNIQQMSECLSPMSEISVSKPNASILISSQSQQKQIKRKNTISSIEDSVTKNKDPEDSNRKNEQMTHLQIQNKKMKEKLKEKDKIVKENEELKRKIKNDEYESVKEIKAKIDENRKQTQKYQQLMKRHPILEKEIKEIEEQIFKCKFQIMNAFNYANQEGVLYQLQEACGLKQS